MAKICFLISLLATELAVSNSQITYWYFEALDGGILTARPSTTGLPGYSEIPGEVYSELPKFESDGNLIPEQQWAFNNQGHGDIYLISRANNFNEVYTYMANDTGEPDRVIWNIGGRPVPDGDYWSNAYFGGCLVNNGIGQRVSTMGKCDDPTMTDVWRKLNATQSLTRQ